MVPSTLTRLDPRKSSTWELQQLPFLQKDNSLFEGREVAVALCLFVLYIADLEELAAYKITQMTINFLYTAKHRRRPSLWSSVPRQSVARCRLSDCEKNE